MKIHAKLTIETDYNYDMNEWLTYNPELTKEQFIKNTKEWISEDFNRIVCRAENVIGKFDYTISIDEQNE